MPAWGYSLVVMAATTNLMSWEAFEQLPDGDGYHRELIEGELQILPPPKSGHTKAAKPRLQGTRPR